MDRINLNMDFHTAYLSGRVITADIPGVGIKTGKVGVTQGPHPEFVLVTRGCATVLMTPLVKGSILLPTALRKQRCNNPAYLQNKVPTFVRRAGASLVAG